MTRPSASAGPSLSSSSSSSASSSSQPATATRRRVARTGNAAASSVDGRSASTDDSSSNNNNNSSSSNGVDGAAVHAPVDMVIDASSATLAAAATTTATAANGGARQDDALFTMLSNCGAELDEFIDAVFARYKFMEVIGTWLVILASDASVNFPVEWVVFSFLSLFSFYRAFTTHVQLLALFCLFIGVLDVLAYVILVHYAAPGWLPAVANMMVFGYMVCSVRGFDLVSWMLWLVFVSFDVFGRDLVVSNMFAPLAVHCVGYGLYLLATEAAGAIMDRGNAAPNDAELLRSAEAVAFTGKLPLLNHRLEVCIESVSSTIFAATLGVISAGTDSPGQSDSPTSATDTSRQTPMRLFASAQALNSTASLSAFTSSGQIRRGDKARTNQLALLSSLPMVQDWALADKDVLVLLNGEALPANQVRVLPSADDGPGLLLTSLSPSTAYSMRVLVKFASPAMVVASPAVYFSTEAASVVSVHDHHLNGASFAQALAVFEAHVAASAATAAASFPDASIAHAIPLAPTGAGFGASVAKTAASPGAGPTPANASSEVASAESQMPSEVDLERQLEQERAAKKEQQALIRRIKRDFQKQEAAIKAEITILQNSMLKDENKEKREQRRMDSLRQATKQMEALTSKLEADIEAVRADSRTLSSSVDRLRADVDALKEQAQKAERANAKAGLQHSKMMSELDKEFARANKETADVQAELAHSHQMLSTLLDQIEIMKRDIVSLQDEQRAARSDAEQLISNEKKFARDLDSNRHSLEQSIAALNSKNTLLRQTLLEEAKFKQKLLEELAREGMQQ